MAKKTEHSAYYDKAREKYEAGAWTRAMLRVLVLKGKLTEAEYQDITGEVYG